VIAQNLKDLDAAGEALRASELRYRRLFESAKDGILILDAETGMIVDVNPERWARHPMARNWVALRARLVLWYYSTASFRKKMKTSTTNLESRWQAQVLAALSAVPLDQSRLFESVVRSTCGKHSHVANDKCAIEFFDALALLRVDGMIVERPHPVEQFRTYFLTEKGQAAVRNLRLAWKRSRGGDRDSVDVVKG
jgi:hypothetical protein